MGHRLRYNVYKCILERQEFSLEEVYLHNFTLLGFSPTAIFALGSDLIF